MRNNNKLSFVTEQGNFFINELWHDKKRYFGLPISFTRYALSEDRLFEDRGLLFSRHNEILLYRVRDISVTISLWQRLFKVGTVRIYAGDASTLVMSAINIKEPMAVKEYIHLSVEKIKEEKGFYVGEYFNA